MIQKFNLVLESIEKTLRELLDLSGDKQNALVANDPKKMDEISSGEQKLLQKLENLEKERRVILSQLHESYNISHVDEKLADIVRSLSGTVDRNSLIRLIELRNNIKNITDELKKINDQNNTLIGNSRAFIKEVITTLRGSDKSFLINAKM